ncbi:MAG TPA: hypothetical protein VFS92_09055, partial [Planctomycetota bacterium]|nr:hypothetical protein [Planctomycetota bacterium]
LPESPAPAISGFPAGNATPAPAAPAALASFEEGPAAGRAAEASAATQPGERALIFRDFDRGVLREFFLPAGVEPDRILLIDAERDPIVPARVR